MICRSSWCAISIILALAAHNVWAGEGQKPTAAFLDLDGSPLARLLEQRLLVSAPAAWLERNRLDELLREQGYEFFRIVFDRE